ncbi:cobalamin biosynthesis protein [Rhizobium sp. SAFR-030]|uniref:cobalamin biosynthesis protein n=1 Tax=Rhizobium sp. SAFR-030 TaxID=3387277 RepID=UPI003F7D7FD7
MMAAGIGCRKGTSADTILAVLDAALTAHGRSGSRPQILATGPQKAAEGGLLEAARQLGVDLTVVSEPDMQAASPRTLTLSPHSVAHVGIPSFCEAAVLAAAGEASRLLGPRYVADGVTCAIAITEDAA